MIYTIPQISINGQGGQLGTPFFGGYIYNLGYDVNIGSEGSSTLTVNLVSEDGQYSFNPSDLQVHQAYNVQIGNMHFNMFPKKLRKKYSARGNLLEIEFTDGSFILDKYFVGLHKKHGMINGSNPSCIIIVGREFHPCDINNDGIISIQDIADPCALCNSSQPNLASLIDCQSTTSKEILRVKYNFTDLIQALLSRGFHLQGAYDPNPSYYQNHVGSLRSVLSSWCHDFGWIFFWDNGIIKFKDLRTIPILNAQINTFCPNIEEFEEEYSLDGTFNTITLTNYSRSGFDKQEVCQEAKYLITKPFTKASSPGGLLEVIDIDEEAAGLCYYAKELRDIYYYFIDAELGDINKFYPGHKIPKLAMQILSQPIKIDGAGGGGSYNLGISEISKIGEAPSSDFRTNVFDAPPHEDVNFIDTTTVPQGSFLYQQRELIKQNPEFFECFKLLDNESQWRVASHLANYFFFVAHYDQERDADKTQEERDFANGFMGKFWLYVPEDAENFFRDYTFFNDNTCGENILKNDNRITYGFLGDTGDASLTYYNNPGLTNSGELDRISQLPFARFLKKMQNTCQPDHSLRLQKMVCVSKSGEGFFPPPSNKESDDSQTPNSECNWLIQDKELINEAASFLPLALRTTTNRAGENIIRLLLQDSSSPELDKNKMHIFLGFRNVNGAFSHSVTRAGNPGTKEFPHAFNGDPINFKLDPITGQPQSTVIYRYPQFLCTALGNETNECDQVTLSTPAGDFVYYSPTDSDYFTIIEKTEERIRRIRKTETVLTSGGCGFNDRTLSTIVDVHDISDDDIQKFLRTGPSSCSYDESKITTLHNNFVRNLSIRQTSPLIKKVFTVDGVDINGPLPTIDQGLQNISITADSGGIKTTYTFGTSHMLLPDPDVYSTNFGNFGIQKATRANDMNPARYNSPGS